MSGLSSALRHLATDRFEEPPADPADPGRGHESGVEAAEGVVAAARRHAPRRDDPLKALVAPALLLTGVAVLIPAVWALLILGGALESQRPDARTMALVMLVCWPVAACLFGGAAWFRQSRGAGRRRSSP